MNSIRFFLVSALISMITLAIFFAAVRGYRKSMEEAEQLLNERLIQHADLIKTYNFYKPPPEDPVKQMPIVLTAIFSEGAVSKSAFQVWDQHKQLLLRSSNAPAALLTSLNEQIRPINFDGYRWETLVTFDPGNKTWVIVAERIDFRLQLAENIILESIQPIVMVIPLIGGTIWLIVSFGLKPISELAKRIRSKKANDLSPIPTENIPSELTLLASSSNELFQRLESSFLRETRFVEYAAHELRTPITALKIHSQNLLEDLETQPESALELKVGIDRMSHLVEQLLSLHLTASDQFKTQFTCLDLFEIAKKMIRSQIGAINKKDQSISLVGASSEITGHPFSIEVLLQNLLSNAIKYTPEGGEVIVNVETGGDKTILQVIDNGPGIPEDLQERVFERFYRVGGDRHLSSELGCGLGLAIVKRITETHGASIFLTQPEGHPGLCVSLHFPLYTHRGKGRSNSLARGV